MALGLAPDLPDDAHGDDDDEWLYYGGRPFVAGKPTYRQRPANDCDFDEPYAPDRGTEADKLPPRADQGLPATNVPPRSGEAAGEGLAADVAMTMACIELMFPFGGTGTIELAVIPATGGAPRPAFFNMDEAEAASAWAIRMNAHPGANVYIAPAARKGFLGRVGNDSDVISLGVLFADCDSGEELENALRVAAERGCLPTHVVVTGALPSLRAQLFWALDVAITDIDVMRSSLRGIITALGSDPAVKGVSQYMRLGGPIAWAKPKPGRVNEMTRFFTYTEFVAARAGAGLANPSCSTSPRLTVTLGQIHEAFPPGEADVSSHAPGGGRREKVKSDGPTDKWGRATDERRHWMVAAAWAAVLDRKILSDGMPDDAELEAIADRVFTLYLLNFSTRRAGVSQAEGLESEGRGRTLLMKLLHEARGKWCGKRLIDDAADRKARLEAERQAEADGAVERARQIEMARPPPSSTLEEADRKTIEAAQEFGARVKPQMVLRQLQAAKRRGAKIVPPGLGLDVDTMGDAALLQTDFAVGKTKATLGMIVDLVDGWWNDGPHGKPLWSPKFGLVVADHKRATAAAYDLNALRPGVAVVWMGMQQEAPEGGTLCAWWSRRMEGWLAAGNEASRLCSVCPYKKGCAYLAQVEPAQAAAVVISALPGGIAANLVPGDWRRVTFPDMEPFDYGLDMIIFDETTVTAWVHDEVVIGADVFDRLKPPSDIDVKHMEGAEWAILNDTLSSIRAVIEAAVADDFCENISYGALRAILPEGRSWTDLRKEVFNLKARSRPEDALKRGFRARLAAVAKWNGRLMKIVRFIDAAIQALDEGVGYLDRAGVPVMEVHIEGVALNGRERVNDARRGPPILLLDTTADIAALRQWLPSLTSIADVRVSMPDAVTVWKVEDDLYAYTKFVPDPLSNDDGKAKKEKQKTIQNNLTSLTELIDCLCGDAWPGSVGVIGPKAAIDALRTVFEARDAARGTNRPANIIWGHFNAIRGSNTMKDVRTLLVFSRPLPSPAEPERYARTIFTRHVRVLGKGHWYGKGGSQRMSDGTVVEAPLTEYHPDALVERMRAMICNAELDQSIARGRGARRTEDKPLDIVIATAHAVSLPIDHRIKRDDLEPGPIAALAARGVAVPAGHWNKGYARLRAKMTGLSEAAVRNRELRSVSQIPIGRPYIGKWDTERPAGDFVSWRVNLAGSRYATQVRIRSDLAGADEDAEATLRREGLRGEFKVRAVDKP